MLFSIKQGNTLPSIYIRITDDNGDPIDLSEASAKFVMRRAGSSAPTVNSDATITNAQFGELTYAWQLGDTESAGDYLAEFVVTFADGVQTFPAKGTLEVSIIPNLLNDAGDPELDDEWVYASPDDLKTMLNVTADEDTVVRANALIETIVGYPDKSRLDSRDLLLLKKAVCYQAAWILVNQDILQRTELDEFSFESLRQKYGADALIIAPLAKRCLMQLSCMRRSIGLRRAY